MKGTNRFFSKASFIISLKFRNSLETILLRSEKHHLSEIIVLSKLCLPFDRMQFILEISFYSPSNA